MTTAANVRVGVTGTVNKADAGTTLPTDATTALDGGFEELGYLSEDGIRENRSVNVTEIRAWQNSDVVRKVKTSDDLTYSFTAIETNDQVLETYYGNYTNGVVEVSGAEGFRGVWVFEIEDGDDITRIVVPDGQITEFGEVVYANNGDARGYPMVVTAYADADDNKAYIYALGTGS